MNAEHYTLGIDIGSTTVKIAILNDAHNIIFSDYKRISGKLFPICLRKPSTSLETSIFIL